MKYHVPVLATLVTGGEQLGGTPFGLPAERWPICAECSRPQSLIAQLWHDDRRLDLGASGRVLFVFQCEWDAGMCSNWELFSGANACLVLSERELTGQASPPPDPVPPVVPAVGILGWQEKDDGLAAEVQPAFFDYDDYLALADEEWEKATGETRLGGVPHWVQSPDEAPKDGWRFMGQLDSMYRFADRSVPLPTTLRLAADTGGDDPLFAEGPNFGGGFAYLFARDGEGDAPPAVAMFWQCS
jgi:hypothetical protein